MHPVSGIFKDNFRPGRGISGNDFALRQGVSQLIDLVCGKRGATPESQVRQVRTTTQAVHIRQGFAAPEFQLRQVPNPCFKPNHSNPSSSLGLKRFSFT